MQEKKAQQNPMMSPEGKNINIILGTPTD